MSQIRIKMGSALAMIFLALLIAATFCILEKVKLSQQENYERMHDSIPVTVSVSDLTGRNTENIQAPYWTVDVFLSGGSLLPDTLEAYVTDVRAKTTWNAFGDQRINQESVYVGDVVGITSPDSEPQLQQNNGGPDTWFPGHI